jgi:hypothetical protein
MRPYEACPTRNQNLQWILWLGFLPFADLSVSNPPINARPVRNELLLSLQQAIVVMRGFHIDPFHRC